jgi:hypothetical protein
MNLRGRVIGAGRKLNNICCPGRRRSWEGRQVRMGVMRNAYTILGGKPRTERLARRPRLKL